MLNRSGNHITTEFIRDSMWLILLFHLNCFNKSCCVHHYYVQVDLCLTKNLLVRPYQKLSKQTLFQWKGDEEGGEGVKGFSTSTLACHGQWKISEQSMITHRAETDHLSTKRSRLLWITLSLSSQWPVTNLGGCYKPINEFFFAIALDGSCTLQNSLKSTFT